MTSETDWKAEPKRAGEPCPLCGHQDATVRSLPAHRRLFAIFNAAFEHWPEFNAETGEVIAFRPDSMEHLRKWLTAKAGYRKIVEVSIEDIDDDFRPEVVRAMKTLIGSIQLIKDDYVFVEFWRNKVYAIIPDSLNFEKMKQVQFADCSAKIENVIYEVTGIDADWFISGSRRRKSKNKSEGKSDDSDRIQGCGADDG